MDIFPEWILSIDIFPECILFTLVLGFVPMGLFYHACISIAASATWWLATKIAWPEDVPVNEVETTSSEAS